MKTVLYTGFDEPYRPLSLLTLPAMRAHAMIAGIDFVVYEQPPPGLNIYWTGVARGLELLRQGWERVIYLDADQLCTNPYATPWADCGKSGWHASRDWGDDATEPWQFSACGMVAHQDTIPLYEACIAMEPEWRDKPFQEQGPLQALVRMRMKHQVVLPGDVKDGWVQPPRPGEINIHRRRVFNAVPDEVCPGKVPEPWRPNDWCAHLTMVDMTTRLKIGTKIWELHPREHPRRR